MKATHYKRSNGLKFCLNGYKSESFAYIKTIQGWKVAYETTNNDLYTKINKFKEIDYRENKLH